MNDKQESMSAVLQSAYTKGYISSIAPIYNIRDLASGEIDLYYLVQMGAFIRFLEKKTHDI